MGYLALVVPAARARRLPLSRDQLMLLMAAANEFFLAIDIYLAHSISGSIVRYEWIPIVFGPGALPGEQVSLPLLVWAPPILGPLTFSLVGVLGISAAWIESPPESGRLTPVRQLRLSLPYSKTRAYLFLVGLGCLATVISSVLDHARTGFANPWLWIPTIVGVFGAAVALGLGLMDQPPAAEVATYVATMIALLLVGALGAWFHADSKVAAQGTFVGGRF